MTIDDLLDQLRVADWRAATISATNTAHQEACPDCARPPATDEPVAGRCWRRDMLIAMHYEAECEQARIESELIASGVLV